MDKLQVESLVIAQTFSGPASLARTPAPSFGGELEVVAVQREKFNLAALGVNLPLRPPWCVRHAPWRLENDLRLKYRFAQKESSKSGLLV